LKNVDEHGDVAPAHVHDPMTMVLRGNAIQAVYRTSKAALNTMMRSVGARQRGSSRPTNKRTLIARPVPSSGSYAIAHPSSTSCRDGFGLSLPVDWCSLSVQLAAIWDIG
jgi:hypothetical protein